MKPTFNLNVQGTQTGRVNLDPLLPTTGCQWSPTWPLIQRLPRLVYHKPVHLSHESTWSLGTIKLRSDGRWSWWRQLSPHWPAWRAGQGVALTKMSAMYDVQEGWVSEEVARQLPLDPTPMADMYEYVQTSSTRFEGWQYSEVLGRVIDTHTGIWTWVRHKSKYHPEWKPGNGTSASCHLAHQNLMDGWE